MGKFVGKLVGDNGDEHKIPFVGDDGKVDMGGGENEESGVYVQHTLYIGVVMLIATVALVAVVVGRKALQRQNLEQSPGVWQNLESGNLLPVDIEKSCTDKSNLVPSKCKVVEYGATEQV